MGPSSNVSTGSGRETRASTSSIPISDLKVEAHRLVNAALAKNTIDSYKVGISRFEAFRSQHGFEKCWPPTVEQLSLFLAYLSLQSLSHKTARLYLCAVGYQCKIQNVNDVTKNFILAKIMLGMQKATSKGKSRLPITISLLSSIVAKLPAVCTNAYEV